jgi:hypothetical protein
MIIAQIIVIIVISLLITVYSLYTISTSTISTNSWRLAVENLMNTVCVLIDFLTHAIIFYIYLIASLSFHQNVKTMFCVSYNRIALLIARLRANPRVIFPAV